eukprot:1952543-Rhodomonas_salina.1
MQEAPLLGGRRDGARRLPVLQAAAAVCMLAAVCFTAVTFSTQVRAGVEWAASVHTVAAGGGSSLSLVASRQQALGSACCSGTEDTISLSDRGPGVLGNEHWLTGGRGALLLLVSFALWSIKGVKLPISADTAVPLGGQAMDVERLMAKEQVLLKKIATRAKKHQRVQIEVEAGQIGPRGPPGPPGYKGPQGFRGPRGD